jgi:Voltage-dependent anion channel
VARDATVRLCGLIAWLNDLVATLYPGCIAFVMATGILSDAMLIEGHRGWSDALFVVNLIAYPWLLLLTLLRVVRFWPNLWSDLTNPRLVFSFSRWLQRRRCSALACTCAVMSRRRRGRCYGWRR